VRQGAEARFYWVYRGFEGNVAWCSRHDVGSGTRSGVTDHEAQMTRRAEGDREVFFRPAGAGRLFFGYPRLTPFDKLRASFGLHSVAAPRLEFHTAAKSRDSFETLPPARLKGEAGPFKAEE